MTVTLQATPISLRRPGTVMCRNSRSLPQPSSRAASYSEGSILPMPDSRSRKHRPVETQVPIRPTAGKA